VARTLGLAWSTLAARPRLRLALLGVLAALLVLGGGWEWFRGSGFVSVERVTVSGVSGPDAAAIDAALERAGRSMSTLGVDPAALRAAVARYPEVRSVSATAVFPHTLRVRVVLQPPVATLLAGDGARTAVAADGAVLGGRLIASGLPAIPVRSLPPRRVADRQTLAYLAVLGAAPPALAPLVVRVYSGSKGLTLELRGGLLVYFGDDSRPYAKWLSFARALLAGEQSSAASGSGPPTYVDVRLPERPGVGTAGTGGTGAGGTEGQSANGSSASAGAREAQLVAALQAAIGGTAAAVQPAAPEAGAQPGSPAQGPAGTEAAGTAHGEGAPPGAPPGGETTAEGGGAGEGAAPGAAGRAAPEASGQTAPEGSREGPAAGGTGGAGG
jgi:hypothetical protein